MNMISLLAALAMLPMTVQHNRIDESTKIVTNTVAYVSGATNEAIRSAAAYTDRAAEEAKSYTDASTRYTRDIKATADIGVHKVDTTTGYTILNLAGKTLQEGLEYLVNKRDVPPVQAYPKITSVTLSCSGAKEVGTEVTPTYTVNVSTGEYKYGPTPTGSTFDSFVISDSSGGSKKTQSGTFSGFVVKDDTSYTVSAKAHYKAGSKPYDNLGDEIEYATNRIQAAWYDRKDSEGDATTVTSAATTGYRNWYIYVGTSLDAIDSSFIRTKTSVKGNAKSASSVSGVVIPAGTKRVLVAMPVYNDTLKYNKALTSVIDVDGMGLDIFSNFTKTDIFVAAASTKADPMYYHVWTFENPNGMSASHFNFIISTVSSKSASRRDVGSKSYENSVPLNISLGRQFYGPLDVSDVFYSTNDLSYYRTKKRLNKGVSDYWRERTPYPYDGQIITLSLESCAPTNYVLKANSSNEFDLVQLQYELESGKTIKTVNGNSLLGAGDLEIKVSGGVSLSDVTNIASSASVVNTGAVKYVSERYIPNENGVVYGFNGLQFKNNIDDNAFGTVWYAPDDGFYMYTTNNDPIIFGKNTAEWSILDPDGTPVATHSSISNNFPMVTNAFTKAGGTINGDVRLSHYSGTKITIGDVGDGTEGSSTSPSEISIDAYGWIGRRSYADPTVTSNLFVPFENGTLATKEHVSSYYQTNLVVSTKTADKVLSNDGTNIFWITGGSGGGVTPSVVTGIVESASVTNKGAKAYADGKFIPSDNVKTVNGESIIGSGNIPTVGTDAVDVTMPTADFDRCLFKAEMFANDLGMIEPGSVIRKICLRSGDTPTYTPTPCKLIVWESSDGEYSDTSMRIKAISDNSDTFPINVNYWTEFNFSSGVSILPINTHRIVLMPWKATATWDTVKNLTWSSAINSADNIQGMVRCRKVENHNGNNFHSGTKVTAYSYRADAVFYIDAQNAGKVYVDAQDRATLESATNFAKNASNIASGTLNEARIPGLSANKITSGTLDSGRLPKATTTTIGAVKADGNTINVSTDGTLSIPSDKLITPSVVTGIVKNVFSENILHMTYVSPTNSTVLESSQQIINAFTNGRPVFCEVDWAGVKYMMQMDNYAQSTSSGVTTYGGYFSGFYGDVYQNLYAEIRANSTGSKKVEKIYVRRYITQNDLSTAMNNAASAAYSASVDYTDSEIATLSESVFTKTESSKLFTAGYGVTNNTYVVTNCPSKTVKLTHEGLSHTTDYDFQWVEFDIARTLQANYEIEEVTLTGCASGADEHTMKLSLWLDDCGSTHDTAQLIALSDNIVKEVSSTEYPSMTFKFSSGAKVTAGHRLIIMPVDPTKSWADIAGTTWPNRNSIRNNLMILARGVTNAGTFGDQIQTSSLIYKAVLCASITYADKIATLPTVEYVGSALSGKQDTLESGTSIKTINNISVLGSGNIDTTPQKIIDVTFSGASENKANANWLVYSTDRNMPNDGTSIRNISIKCANGGSSPDPSYKILIWKNDGVNEFRNIDDANTHNKLVGISDNAAQYAIGAWNEFQFKNGVSIPKDSRLVLMAYNPTATWDDVKNLTWSGARSGSIKAMRPAIRRIDGASDRCYYGDNALECYRADTIITVDYTGMTESEIRAVVSNTVEYATTDFTSANLTLRPNEIGNITVTDGTTSQSFITLDFNDDMTSSGECALYINNAKTLIASGATSYITLNVSMKSGACVIKNFEGYDARIIGAGEYMVYFSRIKNTVEDGVRTSTILMSTRKIE